MFAGIGGFRTGLTRAGGFQCVGHCEIDKYANASYEAIYEPGKEERYDPDATKIDPADLPDFDLLCGGFPCQAFSIAGRRRGFDDICGTLFFEIARLAQSKRPSYLLLENVPGLLSHDKGRTFSVIPATLNDLGYRVEWMVLNSKHFGVPQSRRRLFLICYLDPRCAGKIFPVFGTGGKALIQVLGGSQGSRVYDADGIACTQTAGAGGVGGKTGLYIIPQDRPFYVPGRRDKRRPPAVSPPVMVRQRCPIIEQNVPAFCLSRKPRKRDIKRRASATASISAFPGAIPAAVVWDRISPTHWQQAASRAL